MIDLVGVEKVSYKKEDRTFSGIRVYYVDKSQPVDNGYKVNQAYISNAHVSDYQLGEYTAVLYAPLGNTGRFVCTGLI